MASEIIEQEPRYSLSTSDDGTCEKVQLVVNLPGVESTLDMQVVVRPRHVSIHLPGRYKLDLPLSMTILERPEALRFVKKKAQLKAVFIVDASASSSSRNGSSGSHSTEPAPVSERPPVQPSSYEETQAGPGPGKKAVAAVAAVAAAPSPPMPAYAPSMFAAPRASLPTPPPSPVAPAPTTASTHTTPTPHMPTLASNGTAPWFGNGSGQANGSSNGRSSNGSSAPPPKPTPTSSPSVTRLPTVAGAAAAAAAAAAASSSRASAAQPNPFNLSSGTPPASAAPVPPPLPSFKPSATAPPATAPPATAPPATAPPATAPPATAPPATAPSATAPPATAPSATASARRPPAPAASTGAQPSPFHFQFGATLSPKQSDSTGPTPAPPTAIPSASTPGPPGTASKPAAAAAAATPVHATAAPPPASPAPVRPTASKASAAATPAKATAPKASVAAKPVPVPAAAKPVPATAKAAPAAATSAPATATPAKAVPASTVDADYDAGKRRANAESARDCLTKACAAMDKQEDATAGRLLQKASTLLPGFHLDPDCVAEISGTTQKALRYAAFLSRVSFAASPAMFGTAFTPSATSFLKAYAPVAAAAAAAAKTKADEGAAAAAKAAKRDKAVKDAADVRAAIAAAAARKKAAFEAAQAASKARREAPPQTPNGHAGNEGSSAGQDSGASNKGPRGEGGSGGGGGGGGSSSSRADAERAEEDEASEPTKQDKQGGFGGSRWQAGWELWITLQLKAWLSYCKGIHPALGLIVGLSIFLSRFTYHYIILYLITHCACLLPSLLLTFGLRRPARRLEKWGDRNAFAHLLLALPGALLGCCLVSHFGGHVWSVLIWAPNCDYNFWVLAVCWPLMLFLAVIDKLPANRFCLAKFIEMLLIVDNGQGWFNIATLAIYFGLPLTFGQPFLGNPVLAFLIGLTHTRVIGHSNNWQWLLWVEVLLLLFGKALLSVAASKDSSGSSSSKPAQEEESHYENDYSSDPVMQGKLKREAPKGATGEILRVLNASDHYLVLGVSRNCDEDDLKKAKKTVYLATHPDKNLGVAGAHEASQRVGQALDVLGDPRLRRAYDADLAEAERPPPPPRPAPAASPASHSHSHAHHSHPSSHDEPRHHELAAVTLPCRCGRRHRCPLLNLHPWKARFCSACNAFHSTSDGDIWLTSETTYLVLTTTKTLGPRQQATSHPGNLTHANRTVAPRFASHTPPTPHPPAPVRTPQQTYMNMGGIILDITAYASCSCMEALFKPRGDPHQANSHHCPMRAPSASSGASGGGSGGGGGGYNNKGKGGKKKGRR
ncbi:MAG: hypothetical protein WDW36_000954 [Sanguina aurantia]